MYDSGKIIAGLLLFLALVTFPIWYNTASGQSGHVPDLKIVSKEKQCVEAKETMRASHMNLLNQWRDSVVREGNRFHQGFNGQAHVMSLTNTCMHCHPNKTQFCDQCHNFVGAKPYCWDCHNSPKEEK